MHIAGFVRPSVLTFVKKTQESGDIFTFFFSSKKPLKHIAGQHALFVLPGLAGLHIFSLSSAPEEEYIAISTHVRQESRYKRALNVLKPGDKILGVGPVLDFIFKKEVSDYVFLAQGIGITPFRSLLVHAAHKALQVTTTLIHVDSVAHAFQDETQKLASRAFYPSNPDEFTKDVTDTLNTQAHYYLSGSPRFVKATKKTLRTLGVKRSHMKSDTFLGY